MSSQKDYYRKCIIDLRTKIEREREAKKKDNEHYARLIAGASSPSSKASFRKSKIDAATRHDKNIDSYKRQIASKQESMRRCK